EPLGLHFRIADDLALVHEGLARESVTEPRGRIKSIDAWARVTECLLRCRRDIAGLHHTQPFSEGNLAACREGGGMVLGPGLVDAIDGPGEAHRAQAPRTSKRMRLVCIGHLPDRRVRLLIRPRCDAEPDHLTVRRVIWWGERIDHTSVLPPRRRQV